MPRTSAEGEWLDLVADLLSTPLTAVPDERIALQLCSTFGLAGAAYHVREPGRESSQRIWPVEEQFGGRRAEIDQWGIEHAPAWHPTLRYYLATAERVAIQVDEVPDRFAGRHIQHSWQEIGGPWGIAAQLTLPLHMDRHSSRIFVLGRTDTYTPGEMRLAHRLHRLLTGLDRQVCAVRRLAPAVDGVWDAAQSVRLSAREMAVLALVADGLTAVAVARRLMITERTVRKHLERIHVKLGVTNRVSAVLRAKHLGLLADTGPT